MAKRRNARLQQGKVRARLLGYPPGIVIRADGTIWATPRWAATKRQGIIDGTIDRRLVVIPHVSRAATGQGMYWPE